MVPWRCLQDEERLNEILTTRHPGQIADLIVAYNKRGKGVDNLWADVCGDTSFKYESFLKCMLNRAGYFAYLAYEAMHGSKYDPTGLSGWGTNEKILIAILGSLNRDNASLHMVLEKFQDPFGTGLGCSSLQKQTS